MSNVTPTPLTSKSPINAAGDGQVISETQVKQGRKGYQVFAVLVVSTALAVILVFAIWSIYSARLSTHTQGQDRVTAAAARSFNTPPPAPKMSPNTPS
jgi:hypothetical protein